MAKAKKKCRMYNIDYLKFGFVESVTDKRLPMCLICEKVFPNDAMKPGRMEDHLSKCHPAKKGESQVFPSLENETSQETDSEQHVQLSKL